MKLEILIGMIASGKSMYARQRADAGAVIVSHDALTEMLHARYRYEQDLRECYRRMEESIAWAALTAGRDVVIDRTHLTRESRWRWLNWASNYDSLNTFEGRGPKTTVEAHTFPVLKPHVHARMRVAADARGRSYEEWLQVAEHHHEQATAEPFDFRAEGFRLAVHHGDLIDPVVIDPPGFDPAAGWQECKRYVDQCGGLVYPDGEPNWRAAFGADPGICSCPSCGQKYWAFGRRHRCVRCEFEYPTDWWPMYSYGSAEARRGCESRKANHLHRRRMDHPYYRYGFEHPAGDDGAWKAKDRIDWPAVMATIAACGGAGE